MIFYKFSFKLYVARMCQRLSALWIFILLLSCEPQVAYKTDLEDTLVLYCLLNPLDTCHYLKVSKSTWDDLSDSEFELPLDIWLERWQNNERTDHPIKLSLVEDQNGNCLYMTSQQIKAGATYRLFVFDPNSDRSLTASCYTLPVPNIQLKIDNTWTSAEISSLDSVFFYQTELYFRFIEISESDTSFRSIKLMDDIKFNPNKLQGNKIILNLDRPNIPNTIRASIPDTSTDITRIALRKPYEYRLTIGDETFYDYLITYYPKRNQYQSVGPISNIQGGIGLFASIFTKSLVQLRMPDEWFVAFSQIEELLELNFVPYAWE